ncbi:MAG: amidophosphoribosyltransferase [Ruminococcaceae bacterium]|nr:amidophosphoribosyltransferase [Oscillospiraceae bacterium]
MGGFFGITSKSECVAEVFFGVDYHSHLGTRRGGMAAYDKEIGLQRVIHNIESTPFRTKFEHVIDDMKGTSAIGCISNSTPQPMLIRSKLGVYAVCMVGIINNAQELIDLCLEKGCGHFDAMTGGAVNSTELLAALINQKDSFVEGIKYAQELIDGTASILILKENGNIICARDKVGRLPIVIGKSDDGYSVSFESFAYQKLGYVDEKELGPGEIVEISPSELKVLAPAGKKMRICAFLWSYYGYPNSAYEGVSVEVMRYINGKIMAKNDKNSGIFKDVDYICGVPDSGTPHAIGYASECGLPFARAFIKYTPTWARSFIPSNQSIRNMIAKMKQIPVPELINYKKLLFVDDSIVRGTQLKGTVDFLYENGAKEVHMRSACPPIMYSCKFLNFTRAKSDMELIARKVIYDLEGEEGEKYIAEYSDASTQRGKKLRKVLSDQLNLASLEFQSLEGIIEAIGLPEDCLCTYCWNGKE